MSKHRLQASEDVPFAWETKPGMSKVATRLGELPKAVVGKGAPKLLPPPPCPRGSPTRSGAHVLNVPLPPCPFQDPQRISYHRSGWVDDPFLAAYMECTRSGKEQGRVQAPKQKKRGGGTGPRREMFGLSCKNVRDVVEDGVVRLSQLPSAHLRGKNTVGKLGEREHRSLIHEWRRF